MHDGGTVTVQLAMIRSEVLAATQCAPDDHTLYHLKDIPAMLDEAERHHG